MKIRELGGEFKLIERIARPAKDPRVICGIGDDAALIRVDRGVQIVTTDMLVEGDHFSRAYFTPRQIGIKAMEINVSDIAAMGGTPTYALIAIALLRNTDVEFVDGLYEGIYAVADRYGIDVIGGDTTHGAVVAISVTLMGEAHQEHPCLRSGARPGDHIFVSGELGGSQAGLRLFLCGIDGFDDVKRKHTEPSARLDISREVAGYVTAMEDVSDGLASEVRNICRASGCGAVINADQVPIAPRVREAAKAVSGDALEYALFGGEDFELVYTVPPEFTGRAPGSCVGEVNDTKVITIRQGGEELTLEGSGYDHFA
ncbi:MAG TPA: thiamine-phosphate kinase [Acidobacteriota bacterium]|nr:thiamine-phosphate kinase [Acidobacteriota bacterium]